MRQYDRIWRNRDGVVLKIPFKAGRFDEFKVSGQDICHFKLARLFFPYPSNDGVIGQRIEVERFIAEKFGSIRGGLLRVVELEYLFGLGVISSHSDIASTWLFDRKNSSMSVVFSSQTPGFQDTRNTVELSALIICPPDVVVNK